jgi:ADP-ribose pyrophosphatase
MRRDFDIVKRQRVYDGHFKIDQFRLRHRLFEGGWSSEMTREVFERGHASAVLPYDPIRDEVILIDQFRVGAIDIPGGPWLLEIVAGVIEEGESPAEVARRESFEEAGREIFALEPICEYLSSPGGCSERVSLFCGQVDAAGAGGIFGLATEDEDIQVRVLPFTDALGEISSQPVSTASAMIAMQWLTLNRERLRIAWGAP